MPTIQMEPQFAVDEGNKQYDELSRIEKLVLLRLYCYIPTEDEEYWKSVFMYKEPQSHAYNYFKKRIMDNTDWSEPGKMTVTFASLPFTLKQWDARVVCEKQPNGKLAFGNSRSPFTKEFLKKHEESILRRATTFDIDDMMSLAAVLSCCLHCHSADWPNAVEHFVKMLFLLPGMQLLVQNEGHKTNNHICNSALSSHHTYQMTSSPGLTEELHQPSSQNNPADGAIRFEKSLPKSGSCKVSFSVDNILKGTTISYSNHELSYLSKTQLPKSMPQFPALPHSCLATKDALAHSISPPFGTQLAHANALPQCPAASIYGNIPNYATALGPFGLGCGLVPALNPAATASVESPPKDCTISETVQSLLGQLFNVLGGMRKCGGGCVQPDGKRSQSQVSHETPLSCSQNTQPFSPNSQMSNPIKESRLPPTTSLVGDGTVNLDDRDKTSNNPMSADGSSTTAETQLLKENAILLPSIVMEHYGNKGDIIRISGECCKDCIAVYAQNGQLFVVTHKETGTEGKRSEIVMTRKLPENVDLGKACCCRAYNNDTHSLEIFLPSLASK
ncbi:hypothetical protein GCK32_004303 [Trichostrongylus colubriformis]|uniref:Uncharacterized protein n=1 Tax=Trichostrongylus colubriformis TaxID=6319 RepID=A0AAN8FQY7_TRICO